VVSDIEFKLRCDGQSDSSIEVLGFEICFSCLVCVSYALRRSATAMSKEVKTLL